jgi:hypothetical protein
MMATQRSRLVSSLPVVNGFIISRVSVQSLRYPNWSLSPGSSLEPTYWEPDSPLGDDQHGDDAETSRGQ